MCRCQQSPSSRVTTNTRAFSYPTGSGRAKNMNNTMRAFRAIHAVGGRKTPPTKPRILVKKRR